MSLAGIPGQIALGHLSDRIGREWVWTAGSLGFVICGLSLLLLRHAPTPALLGVMVVSQGMLGYGLTSVMGAIPAEIFEGRHYGSIFGMVMLASIVGGAAGPWVTGAIYDVTGSYAPGLLDRHRPQRRLRRRHLAGRAAQGPRGGRPRPERGVSLWKSGSAVILMDHEDEARRRHRRHRRRRTAVPGLARRPSVLRGRRPRRLRALGGQALPRRHHRLVGRVPLVLPGAARSRVRRHRGRGRRPARRAPAST